VSGNLEITNSQIACGGLAVGGNVVGSPLLGQPNAANLTGQQALASSGIDFAALRQRLLATSDELCSLPATGRLSINQFGAAVLDASGGANQTSGGANQTSAGANQTSAGANASNVVIFNLPSASLANLTSVLINGTSNSTFVIINVIQEANQTGAAGGGVSGGGVSGGGVSGGGVSGGSSSNLTLSAFSINAGGLNASHLLWNFCNATNIQINDMLLLGSLLAPRARINVDRAEIEGAIIAQALTGNFVNNIPQRFQGNFCSTAAGQQPSQTGASPSPQASPSA
jgi:choice-of-anchor A domain-containing protein